ncbi:MAG TPA: C40 family peptidase [Micropepsaceae bacterium]|nr:C40 family peptidase [Micropepsaceae bacterium]
MDFDKRVTPARLDLAAAHLQGLVNAAKFVEGRVAQVSRGVVGLHGAPIESAGLRTQLLFGEDFAIYEDKHGWVWGQAASDGYVGFARADGFGAQPPATHRVIALSTPLLNAPDVKKGVRDMLPMNARVAVTEESARFARLANGGYVFAGHLVPVDAPLPHWVSVAEQFVGVPYLWGGRTAAGLDCSGLVQTALAAGGTQALRDTDMQENALGTAIALDSELKRGDLLFWKGHVALMLDATRVIHANGYFMQVSVEPLAEVRERTLAQENLPIRTIKRL